MSASWHFRNFSADKVHYFADKIHSQLTFSGRQSPVFEPLQPTNSWNFREWILSAADKILFFSRQSPIFWPTKSSFLDHFSRQSPVFWPTKSNFWLTKSSFLADKVQFLADKIHVFSRQNPLFDPSLADKIHFPLFFSTFFEIFQKKFSADKIHRFLGLWNLSADQFFKRFCRLKTIADKVQLTNSTQADKFHFSPFFWLTLSVKKVFQKW